MLPMYHQANLAEALLEVIAVDAVDGAEASPVTKKVSTISTLSHTHYFQAAAELLQFELNVNPLQPSVTAQLAP